MMHTLPRQSPAQKWCMASQSTHGTWQANNSFWGQSKKYSFLSQITQLSLTDMVPWWKAGFTVRVFWTNTRSQGLEDNKIKTLPKSWDYHHRHYNAIAYSTVKQ